MKKKIIAFLFSGFVLLSLASCNKNENNTNSNVESVNKIIKEYSNGLDIKNFGLDGFKIDIEENYTINTNSENDNEKEKYQLKYEGNACYIYSYNFPLDYEVENLDFDTVLKNSQGYLRAVQNENFEYDYEVFDKKNSETKKEKQNIEKQCDFICDFMDDDLTLSSNYIFYDILDNSNSIEEDFAANIDKNLVADRYSARAINALLDDILYMNCYYEFVMLNDFINNKINDTDNSLIEDESIQTVEKEETTDIIFKLNTKSLFTELGLTNNEDIYISGRFSYDKNDDYLASFEFDFTDFTLKLLNLSDKEMNVSNVSFKVSGKAFDVLNDYQASEITPKEYTDVDAFVADLLENVKLYSGEADTKE